MPSSGDDTQCKKCDSRIAGVDRGMFVRHFLRSRVWSRLSSLSSIMPLGLLLLALWCPSQRQGKESLPGSVPGQAMRQVLPCSSSSPECSDTRLLHPWMCFSGRTSWFRQTGQQPVRGERPPGRAEAACEAQNTAFGNPVCR